MEKQWQGKEEAVRIKGGGSSGRRSNLSINKGGNI